MIAGGNGDGSIDVGGFFGDEGSAEGEAGCCVDDGLADE